jgi:6-phosphogluconolactonase (cycloisomerase 2 family)
MALFLFALAVGLLWQPAIAGAQTSGFVYIATNQPSGNMVIQYSRSSNGSLTKASQAATGGLGGTGNGVGALDPLGSQDSLVLSGSTIVVVNAGSNQLSSLSAGPGGVKLLSIVSSGGSFPNSVAVNGTLVYVLNAHGTANITGFRLDASGVLQPIAGSTRNLPGGVNKPHDIRFSLDGTRLLVSDEGPNQIDVFALNGSGLVTGVVSTPSAGNGPFGERFGRSGVLINVEANSNSASTYKLEPDDMLELISGPVSSTGAATCWVTLTLDGKFAFVSNTGSGTLSTYQIAGNGTLNLESPVAATITPGNPIDSSLSSDGAFLYVDDSSQGRIVIFRVHGASLQQIGTVNGLPTTLQGVAAL